MTEQFMIFFIPLLLITLAALISELAGVLNIALDGLVLLGSFLAVLGFGTGFGPLPSFVLAVMAGGLFGAVLGLFHNRWEANIFLSGLGLNLILGSLVAILGQTLFGSKGVVRIADAAVNDSFVLQVIITAGLFLICAIGYRFSLLGIRFRSLAKHSQLLHGRGIHVKQYKTWALIYSGGLACLGGAFVSHNTGAFVPYGVTGTGWIALVLVYVGARQPLGILCAVAVYVIADITSINLEQWLPNSGLTAALPYFLLIVGLVAVQAIVRKKIDF